MSPCSPNTAPGSLNDHIGIGKPWDLDRSSGGVRLLQPYRGGPYGDWQRGSADAIRRNLDYLLQQKEECVLIPTTKYRKSGNKIQYARI